MFDVILFQFFKNGKELDLPNIIHFPQLSNI